MHKNPIEISILTIETRHAEAAFEIKAENLRFFMKI